jgi:hypothetical protein
MNSFRDGEGDGPPEKKEMYTGPDAVISCPRCRSRWRMRDNSVVYNSLKVGGK